MRGTANRERRAVPLPPSFPCENESQFVKLAQALVDASYGPETNGQCASMSRLPHVQAWTVNPYLQYTYQPATEQPIRACPEAPLGHPSARPQHSRPARLGVGGRTSSIGRQSRSLQARRLTLHRPVLNPDPTLSPSERLSPAPAVYKHPSQHKCTPSGLPINLF